MKTLLSLLLLLLLSTAGSAASPGRLIPDFILPKVNSGGSRYWDLDFLPDAAASSNPGSMAADEIAALPGQPKKINGGRHYSGYVAVDEKAGRYFFYYFAEASKNASGSPIFLWINGGPGCSSVGIGAFQEHGPLLVSPGGKSVRNSHHAWIQFGNVLYVDSPVGTGFSYSNTPSDYQTYTDATVAADNLRFLVNWFARFPEFAGREIYLAGEGYAGNYIPQLAKLILNRNRSLKSPSINLKGIILQNAVLDFLEDRLGFFDNLWSHGMISLRMFSSIHKECIKNSTSRACFDSIEAASRVVAPLYMFDLTANICNFTTAKLPIDEYYECREKDVAAYLGSPEVQRALHVDPAKAPKKWAQCNRDVAEAYGEITTSTSRILENLLSNNVSVLIYSGDAGAVVPAMSSRLSIRKLNLTKITLWHGWYMSITEVGGFSEGYREGLSYATVRGAGHFVAKSKGPQLQALLKLYLSGGLPNSTIPAFSQGS
ncbi:Serine carboxypeptidase-like 29 [Platanthera guangdongensis]|uniref:Serine carboxypeptidase-like 29 n=1 Tax=Platanthera guangdongensis TaxID=2320717 RepID=A0ABR2LUZ3_9ASPA